MEQGLRRWLLQELGYVNGTIDEKRIKGIADISIIDTLGLVPCALYSGWQTG